MKHSVIVAMTLTLAAAQYLRAGPKGEGCAAQFYDVIVLPFRPTHINDFRQVVGTTSVHRAGLWSEQEGFRELPLPSGFYNSEAAGVNNSGHVAGVAYDRGFTKHQAFTVANGSLTLLPNEQSRAYGINDLDEMVGEALIPDTAATGPVLWTKKSTTPLGGCCGGVATGLNNHGQVVGDIYDKTGRYQAFLWDETHGIQPI